MDERAILLLCGGRSRRLGRDKRLLDVGGRGLVERVLSQLEALDLPIIAGLVPGDDALRLPRGVARWWDRYPGRGPLPNLLAAMERWGGELLLCPGDRLLPDLEALEELLSVADAHPGPGAVASEHGGSVDPMHALYRPGLLPKLRAAWESGRESLRDLLAALPEEECRRLPRDPLGIDLNSASEIVAIRKFAEGTS